MKKVISTTILSIFMLLVATNVTKASEGIIELRNVEGGQARCYALSAIMQDLNYNILVTCRDITYPGGTDVFNYIVWANPIGSDKAEKLGALNLGKVQFETPTAFSSLFVTKERSEKVNSPTGPTVMQGGVQRITLLDNPQNMGELEEAEMPELTPTPAPENGGGLNIFRIGGAFAIAAILGIVLLIFVLTRP